MKRRRREVSFGPSASSQPKISKFFQTHEEKQNDGDEASFQAISALTKTLQVAVPCSIDLLGNTTEGNEVSSATLLKLQGFAHQEENNSSEYLGHRSEPLPPEQKSSKETSSFPGVVSTLLGAKQSHVKLTPLEQQIVALKEAHPDLLLVCECGYKFQCFGEDAETAGSILNMSTYPKHNFMGLSFPVHRLMIHVKKLVAHGCKVGIVRQKETSALKAVSKDGNKSALFKRELDAVYTRATFIDSEADEKLHDLSASSVDVPLCMVFLVEAFARENGSVVQLGLLAFFTQSSTVVYDHFQDDAARSGLDAKLTHWQPAEVILPDRNLSSQTLNFVRQFSSYKSSIGESVRIEFASRSDQPEDALLAEIFIGDEEMARKLHEIPPIILSCVALAYPYLKQYKMEKLVLSIKNAQKYLDSVQMLKLDGHCIRNLNLVPLQNQAERGTLLHSINRTRSVLGARLLRAWLLKPLACRGSITARQDAVEWFLRHSKDEAMLSFKKSLKSLPDLDQRATAVLHGRSIPKQFFALCRSWQQFSLICQGFQASYGNELCPAVNNWMDLVIKSLGGVPDYLAQLNEATLQSDDKTRLFSRLSDYPDMEKLVERIQLVESQLQAVKPLICRTLGLLAFNYATVSGEEYLIEVKTAMLKAVPASWMKISATKQCARFRSPEVAELFRELSRCRELLKEAADQAWLEFQRRISLYYPLLKKANTAIATLDVLVALADLAGEDNYVRPEIVERPGVLDVTQGRHPIISRVIQQQNPSSEYVPNDTHLNAEEGNRCMILTGPNMGGKSCYLSQVALIVILAQIGSFVPASRASLSLFQSIFIRTGLHDEIYAGRSTFMVEMMETAFILANSTPRSLVIIDELGRGTGTHDGSAIAYAALEYLVNQIRCATLFVTHYPAVAQLAELYPEKIANYHMGYILDHEVSSVDEKGVSSARDHAVVFLYSLTVGQCPKSFGLNVARLAGIPPSVIERARDRSDSFQATVYHACRSIAEEFRRVFLAAE